MINDCNKNAASDEIQPCQWYAEINAYEFITTQR